MTARVRHGAQPDDYQRTTEAHEARLVKDIAALGNADFLPTVLVVFAAAGMLTGLVIGGEDLVGPGAGVGAVLAIIFNWRRSVARKAKARELDHLRGEGRARHEEDQARIRGELTERYGVTVAAGTTLESGHPVMVEGASGLKVVTYYDFAGRATLMYLDIEIERVKTDKADDL